MSTEEMNTAIHEAGHVTTFLYFGHPFDDVTIIPTEKYSGCVRGDIVFEYLQKKHQNFEGFTKEDEKLLHQDMIIALAGDAAQSEWQGIRDGFGCGSDYNAVAEWCLRLDIIEDESYKYCLNLYNEALTILNNPKRRKFIVALANKLIKEKTIIYSECCVLYSNHCTEYKQPIVIQF